MMKHVPCSSGTLMEIVRSLNRSWIYDTYFSLYKAIHPGESPGGISEGNVRIPYIGPKRRRCPKNKKVKSRL